MNKKTRAEPRARIISKIAPDAPEARDEGPRLISYDPPKVSDPALGMHSRYLELADLALRTPPKKKR